MKIESDYNTCKYAYAPELPLCQHRAKCKELMCAERIDPKKDCRNCEYYKQRKYKEEVK